MSFTLRSSLAVLYAAVGLTALGIIMTSQTFHWLALAEVTSVQYVVVVCLLVGVGVALWKRVPSVLFWEAAFHILLFPAVWYAALLSFPRAVALLVASLFTLLYASVPRVVLHTLLVAVGVAALAVHLAAWLPVNALLLLATALLIYGLIRPDVERPVTRLASLVVPYGLVVGFILPLRPAQWMRPMPAISSADIFRLGLLDVLLPTALLAYTVFAFGWRLGAMAAGAVACGVLFGVSSSSMRRSPAVVSLIVSMGCVLLLRGFAL